MGRDYDPDPGAPWFDSTGEYFGLGNQGFRLLDDGGFEFLGYPVPWGDAFMQRVACNWHQVFDPVNCYAIWFDCAGWDNHPGAMAIISSDRSNIPISIRVNFANVLLHPQSERAFVIDDGYTCELINSTNPDSVGFCRGCPNRDYENHGPRCAPDGECMTGFTCNDSGRCVPLACMNDEDCEGELECHGICTRECGT